MTELDALGIAELAAPVQHAVGSRTVEIVGWSYEPLAYAHFNPASGGLYRFSGIGRDLDEPVSWSMILKVSNKPRGDDLQSVASLSASSWNYWKREYLAYRVGLLDDLPGGFPHEPPGGLRAPACFGAAEKGDDATWLWLEDVQEAFGGLWSIDQYAIAAGHLGRFNGAYLAQCPPPDRTWLTHNWLAGWVASWGPLVDELPGALVHPLVRRGFSDSTVRRLAQLWAEHGRFLAALVPLPRAFCHLDAHRQNLIMARATDGAVETVAVDWAFAGTAPVGAELAGFVIWSGFMTGITAELDKLDEVAFSSYVAGLQDSGWRGDERLVRLAFSVSEALRSGLLIGAYWGMAMREGVEPQVRQRFGCSLEQLMDRVAEALHFALDLADEARNLFRVAAESCHK